jgi:hypothetical protein
MKFATHEKFFECVFAVFHVVQSFNAAIPGRILSQKSVNTLVPLPAEASVHAARFKMKQIGTKADFLVEVIRVVTRQEVNEA